jgi:small subunit ribosomal protein S1
MVDRNLLREFNVDDADLEAAFGSALAEAEHAEDESLEHLYITGTGGVDLNSIIDGTVVRIEGDEVLIDIGYKSEGIVPLEEWDSAAAQTGR